MNRPGKAHDGVEERMHSANKAWWRDVNIYRSKDVPWNNSTAASLLGVKISPGHRFRFKREKDKTWADYYARTCRTAMKKVQMGLSFLHEVIAESMWRAMGYRDMEGGERLLGSSPKDNGKSGCGVVKGVDRDKWVTITRIPVPLRVGTGMAAEVMGVCVLTKILHLVFNNCLSCQNNNQCIDTLLKNQ